MSFILLIITKALRGKYWGTSINTRSFLLIWGAPIWNEIESNSILPILINHYIWIHSFNSKTTKRSGLRCWTMENLKYPCFLKIWHPRDKSSLKLVPLTHLEGKFHISWNHISEMNPRGRVSHFLEPHFWDGSQRASFSFPGITFLSWIPECKFHIS